jgi:hypothetical protein
MHALKLRCPTSLHSLGLHVLIAIAIALGSVHGIAEAALAHVAADSGVGALTVRPILGLQMGSCAPADSWPLVAESAGYVELVSVSTDGSSSTCVEVGPAVLTARHFDAAGVDEHTGFWSGVEQTGWPVMLRLTKDGIAALGVVLAECRRSAPTCPFTFGRGGTVVVAVGRDVVSPPLDVDTLARVLGDGFLPVTLPSASVADAVVEQVTSRAASTGAVPDGPQHSSSAWRYGALIGLGVLGSLIGLFVWSTSRNIGRYRASLEPAPDLRRADDGDSDPTGGSPNGGTIWP